MGRTTAGLLWRLGYRVGYPDWIIPDTPAAGANGTFKVPGDYVMRILAARVQLDTDANAANRLLTLDYLNARGQTFAVNGAGVVVTASTVAQKFEWSVNRGVAEWAANTPVFVPVLDAMLYPGTTVQFTLLNKQATDTLTNLSLYVEKFETGEMGYELGDIELTEPAAVVVRQ